MNSRRCGIDAGAFRRAAALAVLMVPAALAVAVPVAMLATPAAAQNFSDGYKFLQAVEKKDGNTAMELLDTPGSTVINARDVADGRTALHIAVDRRDPTWLAFLLQRGANANIADNRGVTPLMRAVQLGFEEGVAALVGGGARVDQTNDAGETPLIFAVHQRNLSLMRVLLEAGANPDHSDNSGRSARDYARLEGPNAPVLVEIERRSDADGSRQAASAEVYGPSL